MELYDTIVIGAGIGGSATAYHLAKMNKKTLLLEQFGLPHSRGSSHGQSRITRYAYGQEHYARMMEDAFPLWSQLEKETGTTIFKQCGLLVIQKSPADLLEGRRRVLAKLKKPFTDLSPSEAMSRYPGMKLSKEHNVLLDQSAGTLRADKGLICFQSQFKKLGGVLQDEEEVTQIIPGRIVTVCTRKARYRAKSIVITPGSWANKMLQPLGLHFPLKVLRIIVRYWKEKFGDFEKMPCLIEETFRKNHPYLLPAHEYPGLVKVCYHHGAVVDPDARDHFHYDNTDLKMVRQFIQDVLPGLDPTAPVIEEACMYTMTPDQELIIDRHPSHPNIVIGCGFSGHGFKLGPAIGKVLAELATGQEPSYDLTPLSIARFGKEVFRKAGL